MKVDVSNPIIDLNGEPAKDGTGVPLTLDNICQTALLSAGRDPMSPEELLKRFDLAKALKAGDEITTDQAVMLKKCVATMFGPLIYGRVHEAIEAAASKV